MRKEERQKGKNRNGGERRRAERIGERVEGLKEELKLEEEGLGVDRKRWK